MLREEYSSESIINLIIFLRLQARRKWNTRHANGTRNASAVASARRQLERNRSFLASKISTVQAAMRINLQHAASSAKR